MARLAPDTEEPEAELVIGIPHCIALVTTLFYPWQDEDSRAVTTDS